jgi:integrase
MAFIFQRVRSKFWHAGFMDAQGKCRHRSTRSTKRSEAQKIANAFEDAANKQRTARQVRDVISELHLEITGESLISHSVRAFTESWLQSKATVGKSTLVFYKSAVSKFIKFLGTRAECEMTSITREDVTAFRNQVAQTLSPQTVNHNVKCLRMFFRAAREERVISEDPSEFVKSQKKSNTALRRPFTIPELQAVLSVADEEWRSIIRFGIYTGQRLGDIAMLTWRNVDLVREEIRLVTQKTNKTLILPIAAPLLAHLAISSSRTDPDGPIHPIAHSTVLRQGRCANLSNQFADILAAAGLREKKAHRKTSAKDVDGRSAARGASALCFHSVRHTAVSMMKDAGIPEAVVMELVGHDSKQMSAHYTHVGREAMQKAAASLPVL